MFLTIKKRYLVLCFAFFFCFLGFAILFSSLPTTTPNIMPVVVIDAGHGGIDGGSVGKTTNIAEATLNLDYAKCLKNLMEEFGFKVVMTRENDNGLYSPLASNKKKDDMKKRRQIVENSNADFVISIHMNSYNSTSHGAQVFYGKDDKASEFLANNIQKFFIKNLEEARRETKVGDYYILNAIKAPSVLVECGFLSNPTEEALLLTKEYKYEVCYSILCGVLLYLN